MPAPHSQSVILWKLELTNEKNELDQFAVFALELARLDSLDCTDDV